MKVGDPYVGEDGQWYYYTQRDLDKAKAYEVGGQWAYYGRRPNPPLFKDDLELRKEYLRGYEEKPYGEKDYE